MKTRKRNQFIKKRKTLKNSKIRKTKKTQKRFRGGLLLPRMPFLRKNNKQKKNDLSATMSIDTPLENEIDNLLKSMVEVQKALYSNKSSKIISNLNDKVSDIMTKISNLLDNDDVNPSSESFKKLVKTKKAELIKKFLDKGVVPPVDEESFEEVVMMKNPDLDIIKKFLEHGAKSEQVIIGFLRKHYNDYNPRTLENENIVEVLFKSLCDTVYYSNNLNKFNENIYSNALDSNNIERIEQITNIIEAVKDFAKTKNIGFLINLVTNCKPKINDNSDTEGIPTVKEINDMYHCFEDLNKNDIAETNNCLQNIENMKIKYNNICSSGYNKFKGKTEKQKKH